MPEDTESSDTGAETNADLIALGIAMGRTSAAADKVMIAYLRDHLHKQRHLLLSRVR